MQKAVKLMFVCCVIIAMVGMATQCYAQDPAKKLGVAIERGRRQRVVTEDLAERRWHGEVPQDQIQEGGDDHGQIVVLPFLA